MFVHVLGGRNRDTIVHYRVVRPTLRIHRHGKLPNFYVRGIRVTGSELVGVIPLQAMLDAGRYFLRKQQRSSGVSDKELIKIAVKSLGLDELYPFEYP